MGPALQLKENRLPGENLRCFQQPNKATVFSYVTKVTLIGKLHKYQTLVTEMRNVLHWHCATNFSLIIIILCFRELNSFQDVALWYCRTFISCLSFLVFQNPGTNFSLAGKLQQIESAYRFVVVDNMQVIPYAQV